MSTMTQRQVDFIDGNLPPRRVNAEIIPLVTPPALVESLQREIEGYRLREQVAKDAFEKMKARAESAEALLAAIGGQS